ncbi:hypothetical protein BV898_19634 [Hypsibius exemplaris]|uniref:Uncharacterized protein n=1 Tax=Hypsibius exemplaris TaxID=2072580 RepID=A0A9X6NLZ1_HYPEX|nr:hypothetical protein BV898_19634 [Hypsibius exemplaris]
MLMPQLDIRLHGLSLGDTVLPVADPSCRRNLKFGDGLAQRPPSLSVSGFSYSPFFQPSDDAGSNGRGRFFTRGVGLNNNHNAY